jgi:hypothetical protein
MPEEIDKSNPEDSDAEDSGLEEIEVEVQEAWHEPPDKGFDIVMEIEREENWPPPPPRKKV